MASLLRKLASLLDRAPADDEWVAPGNSVTRALEASLRPAVQTAPIEAPAEPEVTVEPAAQLERPVAEAPEAAPAAADQSTTQAA